MTTTTLAPLRAPAPPRLHVMTPFRMTEVVAGCGHRVVISGWPKGRDLPHRPDCITKREGGR